MRWWYMGDEELIAWVAESAAALATAAEAGADVAIPSCPGWTMSDLVAHVAPLFAGWYPHHLQSAPDEGSIKAALAAAPPLPEAHDERVSYLRDGAAGFVALASSMDLDQPSWAFFAAAPARFWVLRTATESWIHRWDAEGAMGPAPTLDSDRAAVSVAETMDGMWGGIVRMSEHTDLVPAFTGQPTRPVGFHAIDSGRSWRVSAGPQGPAVVEADDLPCTVASGTGHDLVHYFWGRHGLSALDVDGDRNLVESWNLVARVGF